MTIDSHQQVFVGAADRGQGRVALVVTLGLLVAGIACSRTPAKPPSTAPPPAPAQAQPQAPATISEATKVGASSDPAFQKPQIATDPSFPELRGQLLPDIADFPGYPNAKLLGSALRNRSGQPVRGYRIKWTTSDSVPKVMSWYQKNLTAAGWKYAPARDGAPAAEQLARISKGNLSGYVAAEATGGVTEIVVSLKKQ